MAKTYEFNNLLHQVLYKNTNDVIYYTNPPREIGYFEREWLNSLRMEIETTSEFEHNVIINLTWFNANWEKTEELRNLVYSLGPKENVKLWYAGTIDGNHWITQSNIDFFHQFVKDGYAYSFVGFSDEHWHSWMPQWFVETNLRIDIGELLLNQPPKYLYLAYNRKPKLHREWLINSIIDNKLLDRGWVTYEKGFYPEIDAMTSETDQDKHSSDVRFTRPEDIVSLGDLSIWRDSYMVIVSETDHDDPYQLTEKTWKPIFGLRPFILNGRREVYKILERLGFYTPMDLFKNSKLDAHYENVVEQIKILYSKSPTELYSLWEEQFEMLLYNRQRMFEMANSNPNRILNWPQAKGRPHSVPVSG